MNPLKIKNYLNDNPSISFPAFKSLTKKQCEKIKQDIANKFGLSACLDSKMILNNLLSASIEDDSVNADSNDFNPLSYMTNIGFNPLDFVYINWNLFDDVDQIKLKDFCQSFYDLWYPVAEDLEIISSDFSIILFIHHSGFLNYVKFV